MSAKFSNTTADFLSWDQAKNLIRNLYDHEKYRISLLIAFGCFWGFRISDILKLTWVEVLEKDDFIVIKKKTKKSREIKVNLQLKKHILNCYHAIKPLRLEEYIFLSQKGSVYSIQRINKILKEIKNTYKLKIKNFSTHSFRKSFGREVFNRSGNNAELALVKLSHLLNHKNPDITRRNLGITKEELMSTYDILGL